MLKEHFFASESQKNRVVCLKTTTKELKVVKINGYRLWVIDDCNDNLN